MCFSLRLSQSHKLLLQHTHTHTDAATQTQQVIIFLTASSDMRKADFSTSRWVGGGRLYQLQRKIRVMSVGQESCVKIQRSPKLDFTPADMETLKVRKIEAVIHSQGWQPYLQFHPGPFFTALFFPPLKLHFFYPYVLLFMLDNTEEFCLCREELQIIAIQKGDKENERGSDSE